MWPNVEWSWGEPQCLSTACSWASLEDKGNMNTWGKFIRIHPSGNRNVQNHTDIDPRVEITFEERTLSDTVGKYFHFKIRIYPLGNMNICAKAFESFMIRQMLSLKESKNRIRTNRLPSESKERSVQHTQSTRLMCERRKCLLFKFLLLSFRGSLKPLKVFCLI